MHRKRIKSLDIWKEMKPASLRRLALAAFLMFGIMGPLSILMESNIRVHTWSFVAIQTVASGGIAASIILFSRGRWWVACLIVASWLTLIMINSGGLGLVFDEQGFRVRLEGTGKPEPIQTSGESLSLSSDQLDALYTQRG